MGIAMTAFEKDFEKELEKINEVGRNEINENSVGLKKENSEEIKRLEKMLATYEEGIKHIQRRLDELKGPNESKETTSYGEKEMKELIQELLEKELRKNQSNEAVKKDDSNLAENLILENAIVKRKMIKNDRNNYQKDRRIKDYKDLSRVSKAPFLKGSEESDLGGENLFKREESQEKMTLLGIYWKEVHQNLLFTSEVIEDVAKTFTKKEFVPLDQALDHLNNEEDLERKKINPTNEDYYFSFRTLSGVKSRIFYQIMPKDFGNRRIVVTRIIKQYHTRSVN